MEYKDCIEFRKCASMFEHLHDQSLGSDAVHLKEGDYDYWMKSFYPTYVKTGVVADTRFYCGENNSNLGVGNDAVYLNHEYCNILYQLYKQIAKFYVEKTLRLLLDEDMIDGWPKFLAEDLSADKIKDPIKVMVTMLNETDWPSDPLLFKALKAVLVLKGYVKQYKYDDTIQRMPMGMQETFTLSHEEKINWDDIEPVYQFIRNMDSMTNEAFLIRKDDSINGLKLLYTLSKLYKFIAALLAAQLSGGEK
ncbi:hypothetical protein [Dielma fastidiosa]|uniref:DUF1836 domain-containing protein n=1 Tax=Dielma fastidiosa TaxID=1034346 RepID=A0AB35UKJ3_9FIRM|nr:hypothetical protein [Dielma fastidiosa]MDY5168480.1 hypothetical protein [Dielma fastidiosa]